MYTEGRRRTSCFVLTEASVMWGYSYSLGHDLLEEIIIGKGVYVTIIGSMYFTEELTIPGEKDGDLVHPTLLHLYYHSWSLEACTLVAMESMHLIRIAQLCYYLETSCHGITRKCTHCIDNTRKCGDLTVFSLWSKGWT